MTEKCDYDSNRKEVEELKTAFQEIHIIYVHGSLEEQDILLVMIIETNHAWRNTRICAGLKRFAENHLLSVGLLIKI